MPELTAQGRWWPVVEEARLVDGAAVGTEIRASEPGGEGAAPSARALRVAVFQVAGELHATDSLCTHAFVPLEDGLLDGHEIECPVHQARFDVRSGACLRFPAKRPLRVFEVRRHEGFVQVWIPAGTV